LPVARLTEKVASMLTPRGKHLLFKIIEKVRIQIHSHSLSIITMTMGQEAFVLIFFINTFALIFIFYCPRCCGKKPLLFDPSGTGKSKGRVLLFY
jgi:hypothetical protein